MTASFGYYYSIGAACLCNKPSHVLSAFSKLNYKQDTIAALSS